MEASIAMRDQTKISSWRMARRCLLVAAALWAGALAAPAVALAQYAAPALSNQAIGEKYHIELSGTFWNPTLVGFISSEQFGQIGTDLDFVSDLGFEQKRFKDLRIVLRPARKQRFRIQYTPIEYIGETKLTRDVKYNGIKYPASLSVASEFGWKVWRFGYEYDAFYRSRGFVGVLLEARYTKFSSALESLSPLIQASEFATATAPLPAIGIVARGYPAPNVAIDFEMTGFKVPDVKEDYQANYYDWDIHGTVNFTNNAGVQVGWRRMTTFLQFEHDKGDFKFQGMWFGGVVRY